MSNSLLQTKLHRPRLRPALVPRPHLIESLTQGLAGKLTLISAPAGFGKTTLVNSWLNTLQTEPPPSPHIQSVSPTQIAWLSLDKNDSELAHFLAYVIAALQRINPHIGVAAQGMLQTLPLPMPSVLTALLNSVAAQDELVILVLDDYHTVEAHPIDEAMAFLLTHLPPQLHLVITTREDPNWPLARLRVRGWITELRAADLRFSVAESAVFLQQIMGLNLTETQIAALEARTEGWVAGLQLAALSMRGQKDVAGFIQSFTGSHRFVLDYLMEEVLFQQAADVQEFLLKTSILNRLTASLCNTLTGEINGQAILESLERANLFLVPLDNTRQWYRYHHLFAELLRQSLQQNTEPSIIKALHIKASNWFEAQGQMLEAFHHATAAEDVARAARLIEGNGLPLYFQGKATAVQHWLESLSRAEFEAQPALWVTYASVLTMAGRLHNNIEEILQAAETALQNTASPESPESTEPDEKTNDLLGQIAANRAMLAVPKNQVDTIITQAQLALRYLHPANIPMRTTTNWTLGYAYQLQGNRVAASQAYATTIAHSQKSGNLITEIAATTSLGQIQEAENQAQQAEASFQRILKLVGEPPWPAACEACVGLGRLHYQWNKLETAERYAQQGLNLAQQLENVDTPAACYVLLARIKLAQNDSPGALAALIEADNFVQAHQFSHWTSQIAAQRIEILVHQSQLAAAAELAQLHNLPLSQARIQLAQNKPDTALATLKAAQKQANGKNWADKQLDILRWQALAQQAMHTPEQALHTLGQALALAEPSGLLRPFVDAGPAMARLLQAAIKRNVSPTFARQVLRAFPQTAPTIPHQTLPDALSERELEVLQLLATELSGPEIAHQLMISLNTLRTHTKNIYSKLGVNRRQQAVRQAEELKLL